MENVDAAAVMRLLGSRPRVLALGEPTHGEEVLLEVRNDLFRDLVAQFGYRRIALETDCLTGLVVDDYVMGGEGSLDDVMRRGFSHEWGAFAGNRSLVEWMRAYNQGRPVSERVGFAGFDGPLEITAAASPRQALLAFLESLPDPRPCTADELDQLIGDDARWTNPAAMMDPSRSVGRTDDARRLRLLADDMMTLLDAQPAAGERACLYARTAVGLLRYHHWMADTSPERLERLVTVRDAMMAANLLAIASAHPVLVYSHNGHLQRSRSTMRMGGQSLRWWSAGAIVGSHLREDYRFLATAVGTIRHHGVDIPPPDTVEGALYALPGDRRVVDPRSASAPAARVSGWYGYAPLDPAHLAETDGIVFVRDLPG
jgi:erythromycin esterase-like protein